MTCPLIACTLIVAILIGGLPMLAGVVVTTQDSRPAFTLDTCHPDGGAASARTALLRNVAVDAFS